MKRQIGEPFYKLKDQVAIVTGGMGNLGREFCKALFNEGAIVISIDNRKGGEANDFAMIGYPVDISNKHGLERTLVDILLIGEPKILVNCAAIDFPPHGGSAPSGLIESDEAEKDFDRVMDVNVKGMLLCCQVFGNRMERHGGGSIINISSIYGKVSPDQSIYLKDGKKRDFFKPISYCISKACIPNMTRYLATYFKDVRVNTLTLGGVFNKQDAGFVSRYCANVPMGRMASKDEYNDAVIFLASDSSVYMTGAEIVIDGGYTSW